MNNNPRHVSAPIHGDSSTRIAMMLFLTGLVIVSFAYTNFVIDDALIGRFLVLNVMLILVVPFLSAPGADKIVRTPLIGFYFLFFCFNVLSTAWAINAEEGFFESFKILFGLLIFILTIILHTRSELFFNNLLKVSLLTFVGYALIILFEVSTYEFKTYSRLEMEAITGINGNKNELAGFLFLLLPFLTLGVFNLRRPLNLLSLLGCVLNLIFILMLQSRAVWAGVVTVGLVSSILFAVYGPTNFGYKGVLAGTLGAVIFIGVISFLIYSSQSKLPGATKSMSERKALWENTYKMFKENPVAGVGAGNWRINFGNYTLRGYDNWQAGLRIPDRPHNDFLWVLAETGLIGFFFTSSFLLCWLLTPFVSLIKMDSHKQLSSYSLL